MNINEIIRKFNEKPYLLTMGKGSLSKILKCNPGDIIEAKRLYYQKEVKKEETKEGVKILIIDIETTPILAWTFQTRKTFIHQKQIVRDWTIMCYAAKWVGDNEIFFGSAENEKGFSDYNLLKEIWTLLDEADVVVAHNLNRFDKKKINARFLFHKILPPSPYKCVDTLECSRRLFGTTYHNLDFLSKFMGYEGKMEHEGFELWSRCMLKDKEAWKTMGEYNQRDVLELEKVYLDIRTWDSRHPNVSIYNKDNAVKCPKCNSEKLIYEKDTTTNAKVYKLFKCKDCGGYFRSRYGVLKTSLISQ